jgi:hypothetical protein
MKSKNTFEKALRNKSRALVRIYKKSEVGPESDQPLENLGDYARNSHDTRNMKLDWDPHPSRHPSEPIPRFYIF